MERFDVVVVGAGLAGLQVSRLLGERGLRVLLVDRKSNLEESIHTTGVFVRRTLEDFPLPEDCLGPPVRHVTLFSPRRRRLELASPHDEFRVGRMRVLYTRFLNHAIRTGVEWMPEAHYESHSRLSHEVIVRLNCSSPSRSVRARYLVGADGANSRVGAALGLDQNREWIVGVEEVMAGVPLEGPPRFYCLLDPRLAPGYLGWVIHDGEEVHLGVGGYADRFDPLTSLNEFKSSLNSVIDLRSARFLERRGGRIPVGGVLQRIANDQGLLVGDAAGAVSPLTAGGLDPCLRLSTFAASVIGNYLDSGERELLAAYSGELFRARFVARLWMRRLIASIHSPEFIEAGCALLRLPLLNSIAWQVFFGRGSFPDVELDPAIQPAVAT